MLEKKNEPVRLMLISPCFFVRRKTLQEVIFIPLKTLDCFVP